MSVSGNHRCQFLPTNSTNTLMFVVSCSSTEQESCVMKITERTSKSTQGWCSEREHLVKFTSLLSQS